MSSESTDTVYTLEQVAEHKTASDCWIVIHGSVCDITSFLEDHPGGEEILLQYAGQDASSQFDDFGHSADALTMIPQYKIGTLSGASPPKQSTVTSQANHGNVDSPLWQKILIPLIVILAALALYKFLP